MIGTTPLHEETGRSSRERHRPHLVVRGGARHRRRARGCDREAADPPRARHERRRRCGSRDRRARAGPAQTGSGTGDSRRARRQQERDQRHDDAGRAGDQRDDDRERLSRHRRAGLSGRHRELRARRRDPDQAAARRVGHQRRRQLGPCHGHLGHGGRGPHCGSPRRAGGRDQPGHDRGRGARLSRRCAPGRHVGEGASQGAHQEEPKASHRGCEHQRADLHDREGARADRRADGDGWRRPGRRPTARRR